MTTFGGYQLPPVGPECKHCGLKIRRIMKNKSPWAHKATLRVVLQRALQRGVALSHEVEP